MFAERCYLGEGKNLWTAWAVAIEILRLRDCFALRSSDSAQDDKTFGAKSEPEPKYPEARSFYYSTVTDFAKFLG